MPLSVPFDDRAIKYLVSPPKPSQPLRDIVMTVRTSNEINSLAMMGRGILRGCVIARTFKPPVSQIFDLEVDNKISDDKLASIAQRSGLVQRLNVDGVATDPVDLAHILCAYLGATFLFEWKKYGESKVHKSVDDICTMVLDEDEPGAVENDSHEKLTKIPGMERMSTPASLNPEPANIAFAPTPTRAPQHVMPDLDMAGDESVSSGSSHTSSPPFMPSQPQPGGYQPAQAAYQTQPQAQYQTPPPPPSSNPGRGGYDHFQGTGPVPNNPPSYNMPALPSVPVPAPVHIPPPPPPPSQQTQGFISLFNEMAMKNRIQSSWQQQKTGQQHIPEWTMWLMVDGQPRGSGTAATKQAAKEIAAKAALQSMGWLAA